MLVRLPGRALGAPETSNPIESIFAWVRLRIRVTKALKPGLRLAMAFKLLEAARDRWRAGNGPHLAALAHGSTMGDGQGP